MSYKNKFLGANIGDCPHTEGLYKAARIARMAGFDTFVCSANSTQEEILNEIQKRDSNFVGFSYRLTPTKGFEELKRILWLMNERNLLFTKDGQKRRIAFAGLPDTAKLVSDRHAELPCNVFTFSQLKDPVEQINIVFDFFNLEDSKRHNILMQLKDELFPPSISLLDQLAHKVIENDNYRDIPPLPMPSNEAKQSLVRRIQDSSIPLLRSHFGVPAETIQPTIEGIRALADAHVLDEISLGSSDLSQRYYGQHDKFKNKKNDGGVPYKDRNDLRNLYLASRTGNFPAVKPYAHVTNILSFIDDCVATGMLLGAHQAIPLYWFNQLDGRGPTAVENSIIEHVQAVKKLASLNIPVEMNDPNQWSSRWAHDTIIVADYAIISAVMVENDVKDILLQMQFNKPAETSDFGDLAKMKVGAKFARKMAQLAGSSTSFYHETRTGIEHFSTDLSFAKWQLARSTLLQMFLDPSMIHIVSYCEAVRAATVDDIIESSQIIRKAIQVFREHEHELRKYEQDQLVVERMEFLESETEYLLLEIAKLDSNYKSADPITKFLSNPQTIFKSIKQGYMAAPGIMNPEFKNDSLITKPMKNGFFNAVDTQTNELLLESNRIAGLD
jgi:hypothetical protein